MTGQLSEGLSLPEVSVVIPVRNARPTLPHALRSVQWQTFPDWEAVVVDDGSSDGSGELVEAWSSREPRVRLVKRSPQGLVASLNCGLEAAKGRWLARMDADDICHPKRLERQRAWLQERDCQVVGSLVRIFPLKAVASGFLRYQDWLNQLVDHEAIVRDLFVESPLVHPSVLMDRTWLEAVGGYRDCGWAEDYDLWLRLWERGARFAKVPEVLFYWRDHPTRMTRTNLAYSENRLRGLKVAFLKRTYLKSGRGVVVWGAGRVGKRLARELLQASVSVVALADLHPRRIGKEIHGIPVVHPDQAPRGLDLFHLAAVGQSGGREAVRQQLVGLGLVERRDFLCLA